MNKTNRKPFNAGVVGKRIDIESIYRQMQHELAKRKDLQEKQDALWKIIKRNHCNRSAQMDDISRGIGKCTHRLNELISDLCQYKKNHKAMNLAYRYLTGEIERINKIIQHQTNTIYDVDRGYSTLVNDSGYVHTNTSNLRKYVNLKREQVAKLQKWKEVVSRYIA